MNPNFCSICGAALEATEVDYVKRIETQECPACGGSKRKIPIPEEAVSDGR